MQPQPQNISSTGSYGLATAAYNEEKIMEQTIQSIVAQTHRPQKWIIVSDGSTDRTDEIVRSYAAQYEFIELDRISEDHPRNFTAQVNAINRGFSKLKIRPLSELVSPKITRINLPIPTLLLSLVISMK